MSNSRPPQITLYIGEQHKNFIKEIENEIQGLAQLHIKYNVKERVGISLPELYINGYPVAGLDDIRNRLQRLLSA